MMKMHCHLTNLYVYDNSASNALTGSGLEEGMRWLEDKLNGGTSSAAAAASPPPEERKEAKA
jgi:hypothetical protein